jgi:hypothetical protein
MRYILVFKQEGCPPCERCLPYIKKVGTYYATSPKVPQMNRVGTKIIDINDPTNMSVVASYGVNSTPTILAVVNNQVVGRMVGSDERKIEDMYHMCSTL